jgi:hypothetical protein
MSEIKEGKTAAKKARAKRARRVVSGPKRVNGKFVAGPRVEVAGGKQDAGKTEGRTKREGRTGAESEEKGRGNGLKRLKRAADRRLGRASETLADLLLEKAHEGKVDSTRLLVTLAEGKKERKPREKKKKKSQTSLWVEQLCSEPEYVEEKPEVGDVWVGDGWKNSKTGEVTRDWNR